MATERLRVPEVLAKSRDHAVICTFGADLAFYEGPLWRHITRAQNRVVLADDVVLAHQLTDFAAGGSRLRHVNVHYVAAPITNPGSAHAKMILLADAAGGTLLVGSGNLSIDGYASRGEVFCRYDVSGEDTGQLTAFHAAKDLLDTMAARGYLDEQATHHLSRMWADTPWIWAATAGVSPVRHNLVRSLAAQLGDAVADEPVLELVVHAPFHDPGCEALRRLLDALTPAKVTVLVQERRTSVDPKALARVLHRYPSAEVLLAAGLDYPITYLHAKFMLLRTPTRSIVLVGSANLSLAGLYRTDQPAGGQPAGNIELVNLLEGPPEDFDDLLAGLDLTKPMTSTAELDVRFLGDDDEPDVAGNRPRLHRGTWVDGLLTLEAAGNLPDGGRTLVIAGTDSPTLDSGDDGLSWRGRLAPEAAAVLDEGAAPVWLRIETLDGPVDTTAVYPYHPGALAQLLAGHRDPDLLRKSGSLDLELHDEDLTALLEELDAVLLVDSHSLWRLARRNDPVDTGDGEGPRRNWEDLDFDALRHHPKLVQYQTGGSRADRLDATDLQIVLAAITDHFHGIGQTRPTGPADTSINTQSQGILDVELDDLVGTLPSDDGPGDQTVEEFEADGGEEENEERQRRRLKTETRNRLAWQRFCDRFMRGLRDPEFVELVGPNVVVLNAIIFNHLLGLLVAKGVIDPRRGIAHQLDLWTFLWSPDADTGYLPSLDDDTQLAAMEAITARGGDAVVLGGVALANHITHAGGTGDTLRGELRRTWRCLLESPLLVFTGDVLDHAARFSGLPAAGIAHSLHRLVHEWTNKEIRARLAATLGSTEGNLRVIEGRIQRARRLESIETLLVEDPAVVLDQDVVVALFATWSSLDTRRGYFRVEHHPSGIIAAWDRIHHDCWWYDRTGDKDPVTLDEPTPASARWAVESERLLEATDHTTAAAGA